MSRLIRPSATRRMLARLYDALHDERKSILCTETDTGSGGYTTKFFRASRNAEELVGARRRDCRMGPRDVRLDGRSPDYKRPSLFSPRWARTPSSTNPFQENARAGIKKHRSHLRKSRGGEPSRWTAARNWPMFATCAMRVGER